MLALRPRLSSMTEHHIDSEHSDEFPTRSNGRIKITATSPSEETNTPVVAEVIVPDTPQQSKRNRTTNSHGRRKANNKSNSYRHSEDPNDVNVSSAMARDTSQNGLDKNTSVNTKDESVLQNGVLEKPSKPRLPQPKTSIIDMNKRVNAIMEFIQRTQLEMANDRQRSLIVRSSASSPRVTKSSPATATITKSVSMTDVPQITINGVGEKQEPSIVEIASMHSTEMMDSLTRKLVHWQQTFGKMEKV